jgi:hypothetical protein
VDEELGAMGLEKGYGFYEMLVAQLRAAAVDTHTLVQLEIGNSLPLVGCDEPLIVFASTGEVNDEFGFVVAEGLEDGL